MVRKILLAVLALVAVSLSESYETYADRTVLIERENELGIRDTITIEHVVSKTVYDNGEIRLRVARGTGAEQWVKYPKSTIIKECGE